MTDRASGGHRPARRRGWERLLVTVLATVCAACPESMNPLSPPPFNPFIIQTPDGGPLALWVGEAAQLRADLEGEDVAALADWESADETVATVSAVGLVTAVGEGATKIAAMAGEAVASVAVEVLLPAEPLVAVADVPARCVVGAECRLSARRSSGSIQSYDWHLSDETMLTGAEVVHVFPAAVLAGRDSSAIQVTLTVRNEDGATAVARVSVLVVTAEPPAMNAVVDVPTSCWVGEACRFSAVRSTGPIVAFHWEFQDGTRRTGRDVTHVFSAAVIPAAEAAAWVDVELTVGDAVGRTDITVARVLVEASAHRPEPPDPPRRRLSAEFQVLDATNAPATRCTVNPFSPAQSVCSFDATVSPTTPFTSRWRWHIDDALSPLQVEGDQPVLRHTFACSTSVPLEQRSRLAEVSLTVAGPDAVSDTRHLSLVVCAVDAGGP